MCVQLKITEKDRECTKEEIKKERKVLRSRNIYIYTYISIIYSMFLTTHLLPTTFPGSSNFTSIISLYTHKEPMR